MTDTSAQALNPTALEAARRAYAKRWMPSDSTEFSQQAAAQVDYIITAYLAGLPPPDTVPSEGVEWHVDGSTPGIDLGTERSFIVAVRRARNGKVYSFPALYLNAFRLNYEQDEEYEKPTTGWFSAEANDDADGTRYSQLHIGPGDEFLAWREVPQFDAALTPIESNDK